MKTLSLSGVKMKLSGLVDLFNSTDLNLLRNPPMNCCRCYT